MQDLTQFISQHPLLVSAAIIAIFLLLIVEFLRARKANFVLTVLQAVQLINKNNAVVIDIRPLEAFKKSHINEAVQIENQLIRTNIKKLDSYKNRPLLLVCNGGEESQKTAAFLLKQGYNAYSLAGGLRAWSDAQMPLIRDSK